jgi:hypothetical protein
MSAAWSMGQFASQGINVGIQSHYLVLFVLQETLLVLQLAFKGANSAFCVQQVLFKSRDLFLEAFFFLLSLCD